MSTLNRLARILSPALLSGAFLLSSGCAYFQATPPLDNGHPDEHVAKDVPIPEGFRMDKAGSHRHERDGYRRYDVTYRRLEYINADRVREYVKKAYPRNGWKIQFMWGLENSNFILTRGPEECEIHIFEDFSDRYTQMDVNVRPRETPDGVVVSRKSLSSNEENSGGTHKSLPASAKR